MRAASLHFLGSHRAPQEGGAVFLTESLYAYQYMSLYASRGEVLVIPFLNVWEDCKSRLVSASPLVSLRCPPEAHFGLSPSLARSVSSFMIL